MKTAYFDCFSGISGDMTLSALIHAGLDPDDLRKDLHKLGIEGWSLEVDRKSRHGLDCVHVEVVDAKQRKLRHLDDLLKILAESGLPDPVWRKAAAILRNLAMAEAAVHGMPIERVHFHEVGAVDTIIDIAGVVTGLARLGIEKIYASPIGTGTGFIDIAHGRLPVPAPAVLKLLEGIPVRPTGIENELTTPTGAAIIRTLAENFGPMPAMRIQSTGFGAGSRDFGVAQPNMLRVVIGDTSRSGMPADETVTVIKTDVDNMNPEWLDHAMDKLFKAGALDVHCTARFMKKNRQAMGITVISPPQFANDLAGILFSETTTLGIRMHTASRMCLDREIIRVQIPQGIVRVKMARLNGNVVNLAPEHDDCRTLAEKTGLSIKQIWFSAREEAQKHLSET